MKTDAYINALSTALITIITLCATVALIGTTLRFMLWLFT